ncbi:MAG: cyanophycinase [candidate division KSB1 bacterium]|nr:cyanophycinase [candidate division KSB1 bacterium]MDZ7368142.1 cyanophycinase [candidate division KSB1 bacterium]MDZ7405820.1 cyanophycinase [candidate division KSB1 bacterium]
MTRKIFVTLMAITVVGGGQTAAMPPQGHLLIMGGGEIREATIMQTFTRLAGAERAKVIIFPMASSIANETGANKAKQLRDYGAGETIVLNITKAQANSDSVRQLLKGVTGVFFSGGDQSRLTAALKGTAVEAWLHEFYARGGVIGGTSAGAAVMSAMMITGDQRRPVGDSTFNTIEAENIVTSAGFGFIDHAIIDQHFVRRKRFNRLLSLVLEHPQRVGIGIDENTAIWVKPDQTFEIIGAGPVLVIDATKAQARRDDAGYGLRAQEIRLHVLRNGSVYDLRKRRVTRLNPDQK